jgi:hypothetical protein
LVRDGFHVSITFGPLAAQASETDSNTEVEIRARDALRPDVVGFELEIAEPHRVSAQTCLGRRQSSNTPA